MTGRLKQMGFRAAGAAALIPSSALGRIRFIQPLIQSKLKGHVALAQTNPDAECGYLLYVL